MAINSAKQIIQTYLNRYGLGSLADWAMHLYTTNGGGTTGMDAITAELPNTKQFKARFPAYDELAKEGRAMSIDEMLSYENTARQIFHANGIPSGFYDTPKELAQFMLNDVSTSELETRVKDAQAATIASPPDVRQQLHDLFNVDLGHLTAFFLDPTKAEPIIQQKFTAAQIAAESGRANVGQLTAQQALELTKFGVTDQSAQQGFGQLGLEKGLFESQVAGEQNVPLQEQLQAQFEGNTVAQLAFKQRQAQRLAAFQGNSGFQVTQSGVGGLAPAQKGA